MQPLHVHILHSSARASASLACSINATSHNMCYDDTKSGGDGARVNYRRYLTLEEAKAFVENDILVPVDWHLPVGWNIILSSLV
jgi:hypothetical protein